MLVKVEKIINRQYTCVNFLFFEMTLYCGVLKLLAKSNFVANSYKLNAWSKRIDMKQRQE